MNASVVTVLANIHNGQFASRQEVTGTALLSLDDRNDRRNGPHADVNNDRIHNKIPDNP